ncbi:UDP-N-acetylglucosamine 2-epimerase [Ferrovum sp.]|uniref:UDP-N-acetylglucosamine 2-epimerase n=1 Tax=Ferrovum sp. TaxID=2609467 RepID=UPI00262B5647|nr:UDP-N-acetylglucosamine 2-epimerase [Ferrovum sp.]
MMSVARKILVAITARPSYSRIRSTLQALNQLEGIDLHCLCSGSALSDRHGRVADLIREDGFHVAAEGETLVLGNEPGRMAETTAQTILFTTRHLETHRPDWVITIADRYETLGTAVATSYLGIPLIHVQGGEITGNIDERVRHAVTKLSDIHLVANAQAAARLMRMGEHPDSIYVTGCPSIDLAREACQISLDDLALALVGQEGLDHFDLEGEFIMVLQHADTTEHESSYRHMMMTLHVVNASGLPFVVFNPNSDAGSEATSRAVTDFRRDHPHAPMGMITNLEGRLFLRLLRQARCLIGNSSVGIRECAFLGTPVVNLGERQNGRERASNVRDSPWKPQAMTQALTYQLQQSYAGSQIYGSGHSGELMADIVAHLPLPRKKRFHDPA